MLAVDVRLDLASEVLVVLDDPCDVEPTATSAGDFDRVGGALVGVDSSEEQQVLAGTRMDCEPVDFDAVVDGGGVVQIRVSVGVAYRHVRGRLVVTLVDRNDPIGREPVDRGDHRCGHEIAVRERQEIEPVVDDVELTGSLEHRGDVQALCDLRVDRRVLGPAARCGCVQGCRGDRVCGREQSDVMACGHQSLGEQ